MSSRINSWKNRYMSQAGKETLIKAVAMALPTYSMSCFKLPKGVINRISSLLANFWWKTHETSKGIHWASWSKLSQHKKNGGLRFRDMEDFNLALLGKQVWRIANNPSSLLARVYRSRYFPLCTILEAKVGQRPSYAWRSIHSSQLLMREGMKKEFGCGTSIDILNDPWIVDSTPRPPRLKAGIAPESATIGALKHFQSDEWNVANLRQLFEEKEVQLILKIYTVAASSLEPAYSWTHTINGVYSVKSGYGYWHNKTPDAEQPSLSPLYEAIWKLKCPPKIHHFLWRCITNRIVVGSQLIKKKIITDPSCPRCGSGSESVNHVLFECGFAQLAWASSPAGFIFHPLPAASLYANLASVLIPVDRGDPDQKQRLCSWPWLLWRLWKARNDLCLYNQYDDVLAMVRIAEEDAKGWKIVNTHIPTNPQLQPTNAHYPPAAHCKSWKKPPLGRLKCNVDGSWKLGDETSGIGWVLRDDSGNIRWYGMKTYPSLDSPLEIEAAALVWTLNVLDNLQFTNIVLEVNRKTLITPIQQPTEWTRLQVYLDEIGKERRSLRPSFQLCTREANGLADMLAKKARSNSLYFAEVNCILPPWLLSFQEPLSNVVNTSY